MQTICTLDAMPPDNAYYVALRRGHRGAKPTKPIKHFRRRVSRLVFAYRRCQKSSEQRLVANGVNRKHIHTAQHLCAVGQLGSRA